MANISHSHGRCHRLACCRWGGFVNAYLNIYTSRFIKIIRPDRKVEVQDIDTFEKYADQKVTTFTDCISFILMKQEGIKRAFSFDFHFRLAGYDVLP